MNEELVAQLTQDKGNYWASMDKVSKQLSQWLRDYCAKHSEFAPVCERYAGKRGHLNGLQVYAGYVAGGGTRDGWEEIIPLAIAVELVMVRAYALNQIVDHKKSVWERAGAVEETALDQELLLTLILQLLEECEDALCGGKGLIQKQILRLLSDMGKGFAIERQRLSVHAVGLSRVLEGWQEAYEFRNRLIDAVYDTAPLVGFCAATGRVCLFKEHALYFANRVPFSHAGQVINDMSDMLPGHDSCVKVYQDRFADLRNGYVTYPVWRLLETGEVKRALVNPQITLTAEWQRQMFRLVKSHKLVQDVRKLGFEAWENHTSFWAETLAYDNLLLLGTYSLLGFNKYFKEAPSAI